MKQPIQGYDPVYFADKEGNIYRENKRLSPVNNGIGYFQIKLRSSGKRLNRYIHRLVWETFVGPIPEGYEINHIDHDKANNALSNLEVVTHSENLQKTFVKYGYYGSMNRPKN